MVPGDPLQEATFVVDHQDPFKKLTTVYHSEQSLMNAACQRERW